MAHESSCYGIFMFRLSLSRGVTLHQTRGVGPRPFNSAWGVPLVDLRRISSAAWWLLAVRSLPTSASDQAEGDQERENAQCLVERLGYLPAIEPSILRRIDIGSWLDFLYSYGFNKEQVTMMLSQSDGRFLGRASLVEAGLALTTLKEAGLDSQTAIGLISQYPQLLHSDLDEIERIVHIFSRFSSGIDIK
jgi:hypothetical protein